MHVLYFLLKYNGTFVDFFFKGKYCSPHIQRFKNLISKEHKRSVPVCRVHFYLGTLFLQLMQNKA